MGVLFFAAVIFFVIPCDFAGRCSELGNTITSAVEGGLAIFRGGCTIALTTLMPPAVFSIIGSIMPFGWDMSEMVVWMAWVWLWLMLAAICTFAVVLFQGFKDENQGNGNLMTLTFFLFAFVAGLPFLAWYLIFNDSGNALFENFIRDHLPYILPVN